MPFLLGELFCGPGGIACGATNAHINNPEFDIHHAWANDYDRETCNTYIHNICPDHPETVFCEDVRTFNLRNVPPFNALAFGFPCNDFSLVGEQRGFNGNFGPLYRYGVNALQIHQPQWFFAENVSGLSSANESAALGIIIKALRKVGYRVYPHLYKFEEYGIPQTRHRIIMIGIRQDLPFVFLPPSPAPYSGIDNSCSHALEFPPIPTDATNNERTIQSPVVVERLRHILPGQNAWTADLPEHLKLHVKKAHLSQIYRRLIADKPAYTVTGSGGGGTHMYHYAEPRALTNRERARLQTFPDNYYFEGSKESVRKQIGMAVPVEGARIIFEAVQKTFAGIKYESVPCNIVI